MIDDHDIVTMTMCSGCGGLEEPRFMTYRIENRERKLYCRKCTGGTSI